MSAPFNRPVVLTLARVESLRRVIPAECVQELEQVASGAVAANRRIQDAEAQCREALERTTHEAWQRGFARGHADALQRVRDLLATVDARRQAIDAELIALVEDVVARIIHSLPPALLTQNLIEAAFAEAQGERGRCVLRVHPERVAVAEDWLRQSGAANDVLRVSIEPDAAMAQDDCTLETSAGVIDSGLRTQLAALSAVLTTPPR
jgi:type III secretion protein L